MRSPHTFRLPRMVLLAALAACMPQPSCALFGFGASKPQQPLGASLSQVSGKVDIKSPGQSLVPAAAQTPLSPGTSLRTGPDGTAVVAFLDGTKLRIGSNASFLLDKHTAKKVDLRLDIGVLEAWVKKSSSRRFNVRTPTAVAAIRGTEFRVEVDLAGETTWDLFGGGLQISDNFGNRQEIDAGQRLVAEPEKGLAESTPQPIPPEVQMTPEPVAAAQPPAPAQQPAAQPAAPTGPAPEEMPSDPTAGDTTQPAGTTSTTNQSQEIEVSNQTAVSESNP